MIYKNVDMHKELNVATTNPNALPPIPQDEIKENARWREWFRNLGNYIQQAQVGNSVWSILQGGTGASNATGARANLGLGSMAVQNSDSVAITGGTITGVAVTPIGGITRTIVTAKLTSGGTNGSMTFTNGILTSQTAAT
jgi:hypothetical protein